MSLILKCRITITQSPTTAYPDRGNTYVIDSVNEVQIKSSWKDLTSTAHVVLPKNVAVQNLDGSQFNLIDKPTYIPVVGTTPVLLRGDQIKIELGYRYQNSNNIWVEQYNTEFKGWVAKINPKTPLEIECEDNMYLLKQAQCPNMVFPARKYNVQSIINYLLLNPTQITDTSSSGYVFQKKVLIPQLAQIQQFNGVGASLNIATNVGDFRTVNDTVASVLMRLRKDYKLECFFRPTLQNGIPVDFNSLYCSGIVYYPDDYYNVANGQFTPVAYGFQQNITDNGQNLLYQRNDDIRLGIKAYSVGKYELNATNSAGGTTTKSQRLEVVVGDKDGDLRTQYFFPSTNTSPSLDLAALTTLATQRLNKLKYEGWRGSFESFGLPYVQHGMCVSINDSVASGNLVFGNQNLTLERGGVYMVKGTEVRFGMNGFRRKIDLHLRMDNNQFTPTEISNGL